MTLIYVLEKNGVPFYVGKTKNSKTRFYPHKRKYKCEVFIIDEVSDDEWKFWEKYYISLFKSWGFRLENKNEGGGGPHEASDETKEKISKHNLGKHRSFETKEKIRQLAKGRKISDETKLKKSLAMKGKTHTIETKEKMRLSALGKPKSKQHKINMMKNRQPVIEAAKLANSKPVLQYDLKGNFIKEWVSLTEAKKCVKGDIHACCNGRQNTAGKFKWKYK